MNSITEIQRDTKSSILIPKFGQWHKKILLALVDLSLLVIALFYLQRSIVPETSVHDFIQFQNLNLILGIFFFWVLTIVFNFYDLDLINKTRKVLPLAFFIGLIFTLTFSFVSGIGPEHPLGYKHLVLFMGGFTSLLIFWRVVYASVIHTNVFIKNCILLTSGKDNPQFIDQIKRSVEGRSYEHGLKILRIYPVPQEVKQIERLSRAIERMTSKKLLDTIIIMDQDQESISNSLNSTLIKAMGKGIELKTYFKLFEEVKEALPVRFAGSQFYSILPTSKYSQNYVYLLWHKIVDITTSILGLSTMLILIPFIVLINFFLNKGPLFYRQTRVGKGGREIEIIKFRSMIVEAEKHGAKMSKKGDLRVTSFGKILRKLRIDELPQFISVLRGDMSLIGPRPERRVFIDQLVKSIPLYDSRHLIKPGITGWAQVKYEYGENIEDSYKKLEYDLYYIKNRSVTLDIRIIFKTINTVIFYKGL